MIAGIQSYQNHPYAAQRSAQEVIWQAGTVTVRHILPGNPGGKPFLLVPSLINDSSILDLCEGRSLAGWLTGQGFDVYLLDWGALCEDAAQDSLSQLVAERLVPAVKALAKRVDAPVSALGYCMGGTMLAAAAVQAGEAVERLIFLATPWDFHAGAQHLTRRVHFWAPQTLPRVKEKGRLPAEWVQALFASLDPELARRKFARFAGLNPQSDEALLFVAVEDWINSGPDIPSGVAEETITTWFFRNEPGKNKWIDTDRIENETLVIASSKDRLVDFESAQALTRVLPQAHLVDPQCGHIGMIAGRDAVAQVWRPIKDFLL